MQGDLREPDDHSYNGGETDASDDGDDEDEDMSDDHDDDDDDDDGYDDYGENAEYRPPSEVVDAVDSTTTKSQRTLSVSCYSDRSRKQVFSTFFVCVTFFCNLIVLGRVALHRA